MYRKYRNNMCKINKNKKKVFTKSPKKCYIRHGRLKEMKGYNIYQIAKWFLEKSPMNQKKLQKLCYYTQAWAYVFENKKINFEFEAWVHGPVNRDLWNKLRDYGYSEISVSVLQNFACNFDENTIDLLEQVWKVYGPLNAIELENLSHSEEPWENARKGYGTFEPSSEIISALDMREYYNSLVSGEGIG